MLNLETDVASKTIQVLYTLLDEGLKSKGQILLLKMLTTKWVITVLCVLMSTNNKYGISSLYCSSTPNLSSPLSTICSRLLVCILFRIMPQGCSKNMGYRLNGSASFISFLDRSQKSKRLFKRTILMVTIIQLFLIWMCFDNFLWIVQDCELGRTFRWANTELVLL